MRTSKGTIDAYLFAYILISLRSEVTFYSHALHIKPYIYYTIPPLHHPRFTLYTRGCDRIAECKRRI